MKDLEKQSGLPIIFDDNLPDLQFQGIFPRLQKSQRDLADLLPYLKNQNLASPNNPVYLVWRYAHKSKDDALISQNRLRFDLTLLRKELLGEELARTAGHFHKSNPESEVKWPEVYEVIFGQAGFLIQDFEKNPKNIKNIILIEAQAEEKVIIPPGFGHITVNLGAAPLLVANWISENCQYDYQPYEENHGSGYWITKKDSGVETVLNPSYESVPEIKKIKTQDWPDFGLVKDKPLYSLVEDIKKLKFLNFPGEFKNQLDIKSLYNI